MSGNRPAGTDSAGTDDEAIRGHARAAGGDGGDPRRGMSLLLTGIGLCVLVFVLGAVARLGPVARMDLRLDQHIAVHDRTGALTPVAKFFTTIGTPETFGVGLMLVVPVILVLMRRRLDAVKWLCMFGGAFALAEAAKIIIDEHRPPVSLQAVAADHSPSFPSGHATSSAMLAVAIFVIAVTVAGRIAGTTLGVVYALGVAASRVYLGDHYLLDVIGGMICALAAGYVVTGLAALPVLQPYLRRIEYRASHRR